MPARSYARGNQLGTWSERTHDDGLWLDEEDGKENVLWNRRDRDRGDGSPAIAEDQCRYRHGNNDAGAENGARDRGDEAWTGLA